MTMRAPSRRAVLAGAAASPLVGITTLAAAAPADPALSTYAAWQQCRAVELVHWRRAMIMIATSVQDSPERNAALAAWQPHRRAVEEAEIGIARAIATTPQGIAAQLRFAVERHNRTSPFAAEPAYTFEDMLDRRDPTIPSDLFLSILDGLEKIAEGMQ